MTTPRPILVTGVAGFIGSHLAHALIRRGEHIIGIDNFDPFYDPLIKRRHVEHLSATGGPGTFAFVEGDITQQATIESIFRRQRPAGVLHMAAKAGVRPSIEDPVGYASANVVGTAVLLHAAQHHGCERFVMASSSSVYGNNKKAPFAEDDDVSGPISPYAASKRACELIAHAHHHLTRMPTACLRFFTVYGPGQRPDLAISLFLKHVRDGRMIRVFGDGSSSRDYTYIDDIVAGVLAAYDRIHAHGFRIWNLGGKDPVSLSEMVATIERAVGCRAKIERLPMQPGDVDRTWADLSRAERELDYRPTTVFADGVERQYRAMNA